MKLLICILFLIVPTYAQDCDHTSNSSERFAQIRLLPPVRIRNYDPRNLEITHEDKSGVHAVTLNFDGTTVLSGDVGKTYAKKFWWILYCIKCHHVYTIVDVLPSQFKT